jgi:acyl dehydratase
VQRGGGRRIRCRVVGGRGGRPGDHLRDCAAVSVNTEAIGKSFPVVEYAVGREKIREYARAVGETEPLYLELEAARQAGHADLVAPPMFAVVYAAPAMMPALFDPQVGMNFARMVHGAQEFAWSELVVAGDEITTTAQVKDISDRGEMAFYVFETVSINQHGAEVCRGTWTNIVRGG